MHGGDEELRGGAVEGADEDRAKIVVAKALGEGVGGVAAEDGEGEAVRRGGGGRRRRVGGSAFAGEGAVAEEEKEEEKGAC